MANIILRKGFEILKSRSKDEKINFDYEHIGVYLPPLYKLFIQCFDVGREKEVEEEYFHIKINRKWSCSTTFINLDNKFTDFYDGELSFEGFNSLEKTVEVRDADPRWPEEGFLPIGGAGMNEAILLGTRSDYIDKIFFHHADIQPEFRLMANDIFEFVRAFVQVSCEEEYISGGYKYSQFYKRWGDKIWQIKED